MESCATLLRDFYVRIRVLKCSRTRPAHESAGTERLILSIIKIHLPPAQTAAGVDNSPSAAAEDFLHRGRGSLNDHTTAQHALTQFCRSGKARDQRAPSSRGCRRKSKRISRVVPNIMPAVDRRRYPAEAFFFYRAKKIARIGSSMQSRLRHGRRIKSALESETRFHRRVVQRADEKVLAAMTLRTPRQLFIFVGQPLHNFRPRNIRSEFRISCSQNAEGRNLCDQSAKSESTGPPIRISMGSFFHSYS